jgi:quercetin dioxygenase-like cupin family protein
MRPVTLLLSLLVFAASPAVAQDPIVVDSKHYKLEFENEHVRVIRITYGPGEESVMHYHPAAVAVFLVDQKVQFTFPNGETAETFPNGETAEVETKAGETIWTEAGPHLPKNLTEGPLELILVEMKTPSR